MTAQATRDALAEMDGWSPPGTKRFRRDGSEFVLGAWTRFVSDDYYERNTYVDAATGRRCISTPDHPHPPTLDGAAKAMPKGWRWKRVWNGGLNQGYWRAWLDWEHVEDVPDTGDEITDRYRLAVLWQGWRGRRRAMNDRDDGCLPMIVVSLLCSICAFVLGKDVGHETGVKDHAAGRYVVVQMPDGTVQVCKVKEASK
jgi:hypothetical protein